MTHIHYLLVSLVLFGSAACGGSEPQPAPQPAAVAQGTPAADPTPEPAPEPEPELAPAEPAGAQAGGTPCSGRGECPQGQMCAGPQGCDVQWTCQPARPCTRDLVTYCGCDGQTFQGSGSCPERPYVSRGEC